MNSPAKNVRVLVVDDNPFVRDLMVRGLEPICEVSVAIDGADGLLQAVDNPPDLIIADFNMAGPRRAAALREACAGARPRGISRLFLWPAAAISRKSCGRWWRPRISWPKPFFVAELVRLAKKVVDRVHLEKLQQRAVAARRDSGPAGGDGRRRS